MCIRDRCTSAATAPKRQGSQRHDDSTGSRNSTHAKQDALPVNARANTRVAVVSYGSDHGRPYEDVPLCFLPTTMTLTRAAGILLHPTSLPGPNGIGELGDEAHRFLDFLATTGITIWQVLPLGPTGYGDSPYQCFSAFAGNPLLISLDRLIDDGLLTATDVESADVGAAFGRPANSVDFP